MLWHTLGNELAYTPGMYIDKHQITKIDHMDFIISIIQEIAKITGYHSNLGSMDVFLDRLWYRMILWFWNNGEQELKYSSIIVWLTHFKIIVLSFSAVHNLCSSS